MAAVTICSDFGAPPPKKKIWQFPLFTHLFPMKWWDQVPWSSFSECWVLSQLFHSPPFHREALLFLFPFCHKGGVTCISKVIDISPSNLNSTWASSSPAFLKMYSAYKLNKEGDNIQSWHTPFPIWHQSVLCPVLTVPSWSAYRLLRRQVRWSGILISFRIFHSLLWPTQSKALA